MKLIDDGAIVRGMIRIPEGDDIAESLQTVARAAGWREAFITGAGTLALLELDVAGESKSLEEAGIVSLAGHLRPEAGDAALTLRTQVIGRDGHHAGSIREAISGGVLLVVDAVVERASAPVARPVEARKAGAETPHRVPPVARSSSPFREKSAPLQKPQRRAPVAVDDDDEDEDVVVDVGDVIDHPQLGRLTVVGDDSGGGTKVRLPSGKSAVLRLDALVMRSTGETDERGSPVYRVMGPRRRR